MPTDVAPGMPLALSYREAQAFEQLLLSLQITTPAEKVLAGLSHVADEGDLNALRALVRQGRPGGPDHHAGPRISRSSDLPLVDLRTRALNILLVTWEFPNPLHAGGEWVAGLIRELGRRHHVYLYTWYIDARDRDALEALKPHCRAILPVSETEFLAPSAPSLIALGRRVGFDIVHYKWPLALRRRHSSLGRVQLFSYVEAVSLSLAIDLPGSGPIMSAPWLRQLCRVLRTLRVEIVDTADLDAYVAVTRKDAEFLSRFAPERDYFIVNTGIRSMTGSLETIAPEAGALSFVGNFLHYPNEDAMRFFLDRIFPGILARVPHARVYIVGANPSESLRARHDGTHVIVTGKVDAVEPFLRRAEVCVAPLVSGAGIRNKVNQYALQRRPAVVTGIAATDLSYRDGEDLFIADDPDAFADRVVYLLQHPDAARTMADRAYETVTRDYEMTNIASGLERLYQRLAGQSLPSASRATT